MKRKILLASFLLLASCSSEEEDVFDSLRAAQSGLRITMERVQNVPEEPPLPAAAAGLIAAQIFGKGEPITIPDPLDQDGAVNTNADVDLLNALVTLLGTDVQQLLDQASSREDAIDFYQESVESHVQQGLIRFRAMQDIADRAEDDSNRFERRIREIRKEIDDAIGESNTSRVSLLTDELIQKQSQLAEADSRAIVNSHLSEAFQDVLEPLDERLQAIRANREALVKGVTVVDMPGVEDLKIIEVEGGRIQIRRGNRSLFSI